jgi:hypothetical protein
VTAPTEELLFALRSPKNQSLAVLVCALDEALRDPAFTAAQREQIERILAAGAVAPSLRAAAENQVVAPMLGQAAQSEDFADVLEWIGEAKPATAARPRLTLVGSAA